MASQTKKIVGDRLKAQDKEIELFTARLQLFLNVNTRKILRDLDKGKSARARALEAASVLNTLPEALLENGLAEQLGDIREVYQSELDQVALKFERLSKREVTYTKADSEIVQQLINYQASEIAGFVDQYVGDVRQVVLTQVFGGGTPDYDQIVEAAGEQIANQVRQGVHTAVQGFNRSVTLAKAKDLNFQKFLYEGPDDQVTRPFCEERVGKVYTLAQIAEWDNGTDLPADIYLGGYNCRHELLAVDDELLEELGIDG